MDKLRQDLILAFRRLAKTPGFTAAAILTLALGIGANTAVFSAVNSLLLRPLPVSHPEQLAFLNTRAYKQEFPVTSYPNYIDYRDRNTVFTGLAAYRFSPLSLTKGDSNNARVWGYQVTGNYFDVLGISALRGRVLHREDDVTRGGHPIAVITYGCWQKRFGLADDITGRRIKINGMDYTIVGVTPKGFAGTEVVFTPEVFVPIAMNAQIEPGSGWLDNRESQNLFAFGRMKSGVTLESAEASLNVITADLGREYPKINEGLKIILSPPGLFGSYLRGPIRGFSLALMGVAGMVLLIACANLASLMLARAADRRRDTAIRLALGAARGRLIRQLLTESVVLSIIGGSAGVLLAVWLVKLLAGWSPPINVPVIPTVTIDPTVMIFAALASLITGIVFGLTPALQSTKAELAPALKNEAIAERIRKFAVRDILVASQVTLSVVLLVGSVLMVRSLENAMNVKIGFEPRHAAEVSFDLALQGYSETRGAEFQHRVLDRVRSMPGVESAGLIDGIPLSLNWSNNTVFIEGQPVPKAGDATLVATYDISPGYLHAAQTRLIAGRDFEETDKVGSKAVAIVNETFVRELLHGENPIGKRFHHAVDSKTWIEIVGVIEDGKYRSLGEAPLPAMFQPMYQDRGLTTTIVARSQIPEDQLTAMLRRAVNEADSTMPVYDAGSLTDQLALVLFPARIAASVLGAFGLLAIVLASTGVYGIMAYAVARRTREIGIRMALGAKPAQVVRVALSRAGVLLAVGMTAGIALSIASGKLMAALLFGMSALDPVTYGIAIAIMTFVALAASYFPVRRAISVDPVTALRTE